MSAIASIGTEDTDYDSSDYTSLYPTVIADAAQSYNVPQALLQSVLDNPTPAASAYGSSASNPITEIDNIGSTLSQLYQSSGSWSGALNSYFGNTTTGNTILGGLTDSQLNGQLGVSEDQGGGAQATGATSTSTPYFITNPVGYIQSILPNIGEDVVFGGLALILIVFGFYKIVVKSGGGPSLPIKIPLE